MNVRTGGAPRLLQFIAALLLCCTHPFVFLFFSERLKPPPRPFSVTHPAGGAQTGTGDYEGTLWMFACITTRTTLHCSPSLCFLSDVCVDDVLYYMLVRVLVCCVWRATCFYAAMDQSGGSELRLSQAKGLGGKSDLCCRVHVACWTGVYSSRLPRFVFAFCPSERGCRCLVARFIYFVICTCVKLSSWFCVFQVGFFSVFQRCISVL